MATLDLIDADRSADDAPAVTPATGAPATADPAADAGEDEGSLAQILATLEGSGYDGQMAARPGGRVRCFTCRVVISASKLTVDAFRRAEGASDPDDMLAVAAVTCPNCRTRAAVVLGYGPEASEDDTEVLLQLGAAPTA